MAEEEKIENNYPPPPEEKETLLSNEGGSVLKEGQKIISSNYLEDIAGFLFGSDGKLNLNEGNIGGNDITTLLDGFIKNLVEDITPQLGGDLDLNGKNIDFPSVADISDVKDEDDMASDSAVMLATQQSIKKYVDDNGPQYAAGFSQFVQVAGSGDVNYDETITPGFEAKMIKITYYVQGHTSSSNRNKESGVAVFVGTTLKSNFVEYQIASGTDDSVSDMTHIKERAANSIDVGTNNNQGMRLVATINSITATQFVIRKAITEGPSAISPARFQITWEAWG